MLRRGNRPHPHTVLAEAVPSPLPPPDPNAPLLHLQVARHRIRAAPLEPSRHPQPAVGLDRVLGHRVRAFERGQFLTDSVGRYCPPGRAWRGGAIRRSPLLVQT